MKKPITLLLLFLLSVSCFPQEKHKYKALLANIGFSGQNLYNGFNSPLVYSGAGFGGSIGFVFINDKSYQELRIAASFASLKPKYKDVQDHNPKNISVSTINAEAKYRYAQKVYNSPKDFKVYVGGSAMMDFGIRTNNVLGNGGTDLNASILSLGATAGLSYQFNKTINLILFVDIPIVSVVYNTHYLGGVLIDNKLDFKLVSFASYQKIASDICLEFFMKNENAFRVTYAFFVMNNTNNQKLTIGSHAVYLGFLFNISKPKQ